MIEYWFLAGLVLSLLSEQLAIVFTLMSSITLFYVWGQPLKVALVLVGLSSVLFSFFYMKKRRRPKLFYALMFLFLFAMNLFIEASSWLVLYAAWELMGFCSYALIAHRGDDTAKRAARRAFLFNAASGLLFLAGLMVTYSRFGTLDILIMPPAASYLFLLAAFIKSAVFPFSSWLEDAMEAPTPASALLHSSTMVGAGALLVFRFSVFFAPLAPLIRVWALVSFFVASLVALAKHHQKQVLAYSTVASLSLLFYYFQSPAFVPLFLMHACLKAALFFLVGTYAASRDYVLDLGLDKKSFTSGLVLFCLLSLAGFPPLGFFWVKVAEPLLLSAAMLLASLLYSARLYMKTFSGGIKPPEGIGTRLAVVLALVSCWFVLPLLTWDFLLHLFVFLLVAPLSLELYSWTSLHVIGRFLDWVTSAWDRLRPPHLSRDLHLDDKGYQAGRWLVSLTETVRGWFTGTVKDDVAYIALSLALLVLGVLLC